jgi:hypothetical protein
MAQRAEVPLQDPQARLERALIEEYLADRGCDLATLDCRPAAERRALLTHASLYAAGRLAEIDARSAYLHDLHGVPK